MVVNHLLNTKYLRLIHVNKPLHDKYGYNVL